MESLSLPKNTHIMQVDITAYEDVENTTNEVLKKFNSIDILVNNAGIAGPSFKSWEYPLEDWKNVIDIDLSGTFYCSKAIVPHMLKANYGRIVNISSIAGLVGLANCSAYNASKGGVRLLTKNIAIEYGEFGIRCNSIHPGFMATNMNDPKVIKERGGDIEAMTSTIPLKRMGTAEDIANCALFLASDESTYVTGSEYIIDGGMIAK